MSYQYNEYLHDHITNVRKAYDWLLSHNLIPAYAAPPNGHDDSKYSEMEYSAYDEYFYGNKSYQTVQNFNYAWLHHIHSNPHHWQYWVLQHDDEPEEALEMPLSWAIEMFCDWWSFSFKSGNLYDIFGWYEKHKNMKLHPNTRKVVEDLLKEIKKILD